MTSNHGSQTAAQPLRRSSPIRLVAFGCVAAALLALVAWFKSVYRSTDREVAGLASARDRLQAIADQLETARLQAESDRRIVLNVLGHARSANDIPDLGGNRVVAVQQGIEALRLYVPEGSHTLAISAAWKLATPDRPGEEVGTGATDAGKKTWNEPLLPACGYFLKLLSDGQGGAIQWELTGNHPDFQAKAGTVPVDGFLHRGSSWSGTGVVQFPNQIERFSIPELQAAATAPPGVNLMNATLLGVRQDQQYQITWNVRVLSDGPACVSASEAQRIIVIGWEGVLQPYEGQGKYQIHRPPPTEPTP